MAKKTDTDLQATLEALRASIDALGERVAALERGPASAPVAPPAAAARPVEPPAASPPPAPPPLTEEIVAVISAAVAAFLGERAHVRQIRLISSPAWAQQGRVSVQASHRLQR